MKSSKGQIAESVLNGRLEGSGLEGEARYKLLSQYGLLSPRGTELSALNRKVVAKLVDAGLLGVTTGGYRATGELWTELRARFLDRMRLEEEAGAEKVEGLAAFLSGAWYYRRRPFAYAAFVAEMPPNKDNPRLARLAYESVLAAAGASDKDALAYGEAIAQLHLQPTFFGAEIQPPSVAHLAEGCKKTVTGKRREDS